ncbi:sulfotransferase [Shewanella benthica]|uniref:sulfotransferase n=1 Tax=Shewanella benthica TaxID=43661 RepID=UPI00187A059A|nr:sulfotransferase [Shewanella benthica]MBE7213943.1 sulfotransferase [Shewanella benthica]MCL1063832.1 sulfotransferase [Shewanella benthica]
MYNYFLDVSNTLEVEVQSPTLGQIALPSIVVKGYVITNEALKSIACDPLFDDEIAFDVELHDAPRLRKELNIKDSDHLCRFKIVLNAEKLVDDLHFAISALTASGLTLKLASGFIQPVEPIKDVVFVVGSPRSGTSALGKSLRRGLKANAHGESHVIEGFDKILETHNEFFEHSVTAKVKGNFVNQLPSTVFLAEQLTVLRRLYKRYYGSQVHLDKTPGIPMLNALPLAMMAWPNAKVIFCKRRGMENIASRIIKFPNVTFEAHLKQWRASFTTWRCSKQKLNKRLRNNDWFIEVDQRDMAISPSAISQRLVDFLLISERQGKAILKALNGDKPEQTFALDSPVKAMKDFGWSRDQEELFQVYCSKEMERQGYSFDESYFSNFAQSVVKAIIK